MQQAFSSDTIPTLHKALLAIEALHASWYKRIDREKYAPFEAALISATEKLNEYYMKTSASDAHILAMGMYCVLYVLCITLIFGNASASPRQEDGTFQKILGKGIAERHSRPR